METPVRVQRSHCTPRSTVKVVSVTESRRHAENIDAFRIKPQQNCCFFKRRKLQVYLFCSSSTTIIYDWSIWPLWVLKKIIFFARDSPFFLVVVHDQVLRFVILLSFLVSGFFTVCFAMLNLDHFCLWVSATSLSPVLGSSTATISDKNHNIT